jgi:hypothetical protein
MIRRKIMPNKNQNRVYASTVIQKHDSSNAVVGVTAHCKCGNTFTDEVIAGIGSDIIKVNRFTESRIQKLINIKSCPFCGEKVNITSVFDERFNHDGFVIECKNMGCIFKRSNPNQSLDNLLDDWNTRVNT